MRFRGDDTGLVGQVQKMENVGMASKPLNHILAGSLAAAALAFSHPASAGDQIDLAYVVEMAGATVMKARYHADIGADSFATSLSGKSSGMTSYFSEYKMNLSATGRVDGAQFIPGVFENDRKKTGKKKRSTDIVWQPDGTVTITRGSETEAPPPKVAASLGNTASDPLTALLKMANSQKDKPCSGKFRVFDGKDVFDLSLAGRSGATSAHDCVLTWLPIAGADFDEGETDPESYGLRLAPLQLPAGKVIHIPMQITGKSKGLKVTVSAAAVTLNGQALALKNAD